MSRHQAEPTPHADWLNRIGAATVNHNRRVRTSTIEIDRSTGQLRCFITIAENGRPRYLGILVLTPDPIMFQTAIE